MKPHGWLVIEPKSKWVVSADGRSVIVRAALDVDMEDADDA